MVLLTSASNITISYKAPSKYLQAIIDADGRPQLEQRLATCFVKPEALDAALNNEYEGFLAIRSTTLPEEALRLTEFEQPKAPDNGGVILLPCDDPEN